MILDQIKEYKEAKINLKRRITGEFRQNLFIYLIFFLNLFKLRID
jgi:hypothetical protein